MNIKIFLGFILLIPFWFKSQNKLREDTAVPLLSNDKWGWADLFTKKTLIEPIYDSVDYDDKKGFHVFKNNKIGIVESKNAKEYFVNFSSEIIKEISLEKTSFLNDSNLPSLIQKKER